MTPDELRAALAERAEDWTYRGRNMTPAEARSYATFLEPVVRAYAAAELRAAGEQDIGEAFPYQRQRVLDRAHDVEVGRDRG